MTRKKGVSIGAAMKQRMNSHDTAEPVADEQVVQKEMVVHPPSQEGASNMETDPLESFNTRLPRSLQRRLKIHVAINNTKIQDVLHQAIDEYLKKQGH